MLKLFCTVVPLILFSILSLTVAKNETFLYSDRTNSNTTSIEITPTENLEEQSTDATLKAAEQEEGDKNKDIAYAFRSPENSPEVRDSKDALTPEDKQIKATWGGDCISQHWQRCSKIKFWGGPYYVKDKRDPDKLIEKYTELKCDGPDEKYYCLENGWTVARCHLMCMGALCNKDYLLKFDKVVKHEGQCQSPGG